MQNGQPSSIPGPAVAELQEVPEQPDGLQSEAEAAQEEAVVQAQVDALLVPLQLTQSSFIEIEEPVSDFACNMAPVREVVETRTPRIYQWRDENGVLHFGDRPPVGVESTQFDAAEDTAVQYFQLNIDFRGTNTVPYFRNQIQAQVTAIYGILADMLGDQRLKQVDLNVIIFPDTESYQQYATATGGAALANTGGFYTILRNEAVTYLYDDQEQTLAVTRHEAMHVILNGLLALGSPWLHEGTAVYFEQLSMREQYTQIGPNTDLLLLARTALEEGYLSDLGGFLEASAAQWRSGEEAWNYALAWSLVYFLLDSGNGRGAFTALLQRTADDYCTPTSSTEQLNLNYPGGLSALQQDFYAWLADPAEKRIHRY